MDSCEFCAGVGGTVLWESATWRVVLVEDSDYPGFCRVVWTAHVREMTDLAPGERIALMNVVFAVEEVVRSLFAPDKMNLASLGNMTPHVHWHVIPRWQDDRHFPGPIWASPQREPLRRRPVVSADAMRRALREQLHPDEPQGGQP
ncbi:MAG: HIT family protein [Dechloromonas sp.]|jgi:diadenosine tetraphosphate (Ap4A) HIT family hydrolase|nr:HIT family protein [Dechloromonas sp.]